MPNGVDRRAIIDAETAKALLLVNGGRAVALLVEVDGWVRKRDIAPYSQLNRQGLPPSGRWRCKKSIPSNSYVRMSPPDLRT